MLTDVLKATYSAQDCSYALQFRNFTNFRRDITRGGQLLFPRRTAPGPGGGEYRYAHLVEMAILLSVGTYRNRHLGKSVMWGLARLLQGNDYGSKKINALPNDQRSAIFNGLSEFADTDFPEASPKDLQWLVDFPTVYFDKDFISRDPEAPTLMLYNSAAHRGGPAEVELVEDMPATELQERVIALCSQGATSQDVAAYIEEQFDDIPVLNLTTMLRRIDERLALRLKSQSIRGA
tara:strand:- start:7093 stop:7797 length:705 start_codon:yes stop_codon:yes gene_type:complete